jgi:hypothetical protein
VASLCEDENETSVPIKDGEFLDYLSDCYLKDSVVISICENTCKNDSQFKCLERVIIKK